MKAERKTRQKTYTDYSYVTHNELKKILNLNADAVDFVLSAGSVLSTVIGARKKFILGHVRNAQESLLKKQHGHADSIANRIVPTMGREFRKAQ